MPDIPDAQPVQPGEFCSVCSIPLPTDQDTITIIGRGAVNEVCSVACGLDLMETWHRQDVEEERARRNPPS